MKPPYSLAFFIAAEASMALQDQCRWQSTRFAFSKRLTGFTDFFEMSYKWKIADAFFLVDHHCDQQKPKYRFRLLCIFLIKWLRDFFTSKINQDLWKSEDCSCLQKCSTGQCSHYQIPIFLCFQESFWFLSVAIWNLKVGEDDFAAWNVWPCLNISLISDAPSAISPAKIEGSPPTKGKRTIKQKNEEPDLQKYFSGRLSRQVLVL